MRVCFRSGSYVKSRLYPTSTHWGNFLVESDGTDIQKIHNHEVDENPSPLGQSLLSMKDPKTRIGRPAVRKSFLGKAGKTDGKLRGREPFVEVDWDTAVKLAVDALNDVKAQYGNEAIYSGSYGWSSAGRFITRKVRYIDF